MLPSNLSALWGLYRVQEMVKLLESFVSSERQLLIIADDIKVSHRPLLLETQPQ